MQKDQEDPRAGGKKKGGGGGSLYTQVNMKNHFFGYQIRPLCKNSLLGKSQKLSQTPGPGPTNWIKVLHVTVAMYMEADVCDGVDPGFSILNLMQMACGYF